MFADFVLTREARLAPGATILVYRDKATVQEHISRSMTGPSKVCVLIPKCVAVPHTGL